MNVINYKNTLKCTEYCVWYDKGQEIIHKFCWKLHEWDFFSNPSSGMKKAPNELFAQSTGFFITKKLSGALNKLFCFIFPVDL